MHMRGLLLAVMTLTVSPLCSTIIFLHGSFAVNSTWYRPGGAFYEEVSTRAPKKNQTLSSFSWSGKFTSRAIIEDAGKLVEYLLSLPADDEIVIVAHSNGGNVTSYATIILAELYQALSASSEAGHETRSIHIPQRLYAPFLETSRTKLHEISPTLSLDIEAQITQLYTKLCQHYLHRSPLGMPSKKFFIKEIFLLGTPINDNIFSPDMNIVEHIYNLYSEGDPVQAIAGDRHLPDHERSANLHVAVHQVVPHCLDCTDEAEENGTPVAPCHECIHAPVVGKWLLDIPETVQFYNAHSQQSLLKDGMLWLDEEDAPVYEPNPSFDQAPPAYTALQSHQDQPNT